MNYQWNWKIFWEASANGAPYWQSLLTGLKWTLVVALSAWVIALVVGTIVGVARTTPNKWAVGIGNAWVELFRNIPLLVQMFLWYFVMPEFLPKSWGDALKAWPESNIVSAVLCLGFFTSARVAEQVKAGINSLPRGQRMAGTAMGLTLPQTYRYILLPMAGRIVIPPLTSEFLNIIKNSSVALVISVVELTGAARGLQEESFKVFEAFTAATIIYLMVNGVVLLIMRFIERKSAVPGLIAAGGTGGH
jgi:glutamate/aspartate transport system permease protein